MRRKEAAGMVIMVLLSVWNINAQKSSNTMEENGKLVSYTETGIVKMIINKDMVDRFNSIEVNDDYITWNYLYSKYDWVTIRYIAKACRNNEINITSKADVERIAYTYKKSLETIFRTDIRSLPEGNGNIPLTTAIIPE